MKQSWKKALFSHEAILLAVLVAEWLYFDATTRSFGTFAAQETIMRHSVEIGLLALVMTPIILTGGIDLSVASLLGLSAVIFGKLTTEAQIAAPLAIAVTLACGALAGGLNAFLITWLRLPPLIVTLGTYSLFRGLAEALARGYGNYSGFPKWFEFLGNGSWLGLPTQMWIFLAVAAGVWLLVHQTTYGRAFRAIGFSPEGTRYAGIPVERRLALAYVLAGVVAALAGIIYTARLGQAKADAGVGYELAAITAVVLGGTSIFGGRGSVHGTLLGVAAVAVLVKGIEHARLARELGGVFTGVLLILALLAGVLPKVLSNLGARLKSARSIPQPQPSA